MKTASLLAASLLVVAAFALQAQEPTPVPSVPAAPVKGKVLLLNNDRGMEGDIERVGDSYRIRRPVGEVTIPADKAKRLCADWDDALRQMRSESNLADPDERLRLSRWCVANGLRQEALAEAKAALALRPGSKQVQQIVQMLQRTAETASASPTASAPAVEASNAGTAPAVDIASESFAAFVSKVQPILMNTCASCHCYGKGGEFHLYKPHEGGAKIAAMRNLASVLAQLAPDRPAASPLLAKAVSAHGTASVPPIQGRKTAPFRTMEIWVEQLIASHPHLRSDLKLASATSPQTPAAASALPANANSRPVPRKDEIAVPTPNVPLDPAAKTPQPLPGGAADAAIPLPVPSPAATDTPNDEFDPALFNRTTGPQKK